MTDQIPVDRSALTARVMKSLARIRAHRDVLSVRRSDGTAPIIVVLPDDCVGDVNAQVAAVGGSANVILAERDSFTIWSWDVDGIEEIDPIDVHHQSTIAMLRLWLAGHPDDVTSFNILTGASQAHELAYQF